MKTFGDRTQLDVRFERTGLPRKLSPDAQLALFRILQECLSNAAKHAAPKQVQVKLDYDLDRVHLIVRDDGKGFDPKQTPRGHYGLLNMRERAMKLGGDLIVDSAPGNGTRVSFSLPTEPYRPRGSRSAPLPPSASSSSRTRPRSSRTSSACSRATRTSTSSAPRCPARPRSRRCPG